MSDDLDELIWAWLDNTADEHAVTSLDARLQADPAACKRFVILGSTDGVLRSDQVHNDVEKEIVRQRRRPVLNARSIRHTRSVQNTFLIPAAVAATLVIIITAVITGKSTNPHWKLADHQPAPPLVESKTDYLVLQRSDQDTTVRLSPVTFVEIINAEKIYIRSGIVNIEAAHQKPGHQLVISTPHAAVRVIGTQFRVAVDDKRTYLTVQQGIVSFTPHGQEGKNYQPGETTTYPPQTISTNITVPVQELAITGFVLIDAISDIAIRPLRDDDVIDLATLSKSKINIKFETTEQVVSVTSRLDGRIVQQNRTGIENTRPFSLAGNSRENRIDYHPLLLELGSHDITATPYPEINAGGTPGKTAHLHITVVDSRLKK